MFHHQPDFRNDAAARFVEKLAERDLLMAVACPQTIRDSLHLDITRNDVDRALEIIAKVAAGH